MSQSGFELIYRYFCPHPYGKEYNNALDAIGIEGHWFPLYDALAGPNAEQVLLSLNKWVEAYLVKKNYMRTIEDGTILDGLSGESAQECIRVLTTEAQRKRDLNRAMNQTVKDK